MVDDFKSYPLVMILGVCLALLTPLGCNDGGGDDATTIDCYEDFASACGWEQAGIDNLFVGTVLNDNSPDLEPEVIWLFTR